MRFLWPNGSLQGFFGRVDRGRITIVQEYTAKRLGSPDESHDATALMEHDSTAIRGNHIEFQSHPCVRYPFSGGFYYWLLCLPRNLTHEARGRIWWIEIFCLTAEFYDILKPVLIGMVTSSWLMLESTFLNHQRPLVWWFLWREQSLTLAIDHIIQLCY